MSKFRYILEFFPLKWEYNQSRWDTRHHVTFWHKQDCGLGSLGSEGGSDKVGRQAGVQRVCWPAPASPGTRNSQLSPLLCHNRAVTNLVYFTWNGSGHGEVLYKCTFVMSLSMDNKEFVKSEVTESKTSNDIKSSKCPLVGPQHLFQFPISKSWWWVQEDETVCVP